MKTAPRCSDCRHCRVLTTDVIERLPTRCASPKTDQAMAFTDFIRQDSWLVSRVTGTCGQEGRFFESRYKPVPIKRYSMARDWASVIGRLILAFCIIFAIIYAGSMFQW